jgi:hypothetical protein
MSAPAISVESTFTNTVYNYLSESSDEYEYNTSDDDTSYKSESDASSGYDSFSDEDVQYFDELGVFTFDIDNGLINIGVDISDIIFISPTPNDIDERASVNSLDYDSFSEVED